MYYEFKSPLTVQLEITSKCNQRCIHCYNYWRVNSDKIEETTMCEENLFRVMKNLKDSEVMHMAITGGEPMMCPGLMVKALKLAKDFKIGCSINSNLTLLNLQIANEIKDNRATVLTSMLSSNQEKYDKLSGVKGSHQRLINGIKILLDVGVSVAVNMVVMRQNVDEVYETGKFVKKLGIDRFTSTKVSPSLGDDIFEKKLRISKEENIKLFDQLLCLENEFSMFVDTLTAYPACLSSNWEKYGKFLLSRSCSAGKTFCAIGSNGKLRACVQHDKEYGDTTKESIISIWPRLREWRNGNFLPNECKKCKYLFVCGAGCRATCQFYGDIKSLDPDTVGNNFNPILKESEEQILFSPDFKAIVNPSLKFREEDMGILLIFDRMKTSVVTRDSAYLLKRLSQKESFKLGDIFTEFNLHNEKDKNFVYALCKKGVLISASV